MNRYEVRYDFETDSWYILDTNLNSRVVLYEVNFEMITELFGNENNREGLGVGEVRHKKPSHSKTSPAENRPNMKVAVS